ncbi:glycolate oxidase [Halobacillus andaensis]|uniref:Glycolate oxidase n=1 Tax=Halobacillus andaensis TaxID=1176239 RepID=A0A917B2C2_HALAA|nr:FAD-binding oxidoreductase [Halobacillus andaensis]MBP2003802.1 glycolate oxidase FAD binding subunit [Halobacillus andaensis]GGF13361.1 glycolate oxidase [Halobacillus andaensis]
MDFQASHPGQQNGSSVSLVDRFGNKGAAVVTPKSEDEISEILQKANQEGKSVSIESGGSKRGYGGIKENYDYTLSMAEYKGVVEHNVGDMTVTVRAGTTITELQEFLQEHHQMIAIDPNWPDQSTIGGVIAANESGPKRLKYGSARDLVIGLRVVYPDGQVIRTGGKVVKNVAGYDMNKLFIGAMGTLGVITEITMKLRPIPKYESLVQVSASEDRIDDLKQLGVSIQDSMKEPVTLELLNPALSKKMINREAYTLLIAFEDVEKSCRDQEEWIEKHKPDGCYAEVLTQQEAQNFWKTFRSHAPNSLTDKAAEITQAVVKVASKNMDVYQIMKESKSIELEHDVSVEAHGGLGHGISHYIVSGKGEEVTAAVYHLRRITEVRKGYAVVKHLLYDLRNQIDIWGGKTSYFFLFEGIKHTIDPNNTLNHQRFIGGI